MLRSRLLLVVCACLVALVTPGVALAHGIHAGSTDSVADFVWLGIRHMVGGWDHLLFIAGIVLLAREVKLAAKLISLFVAGHSTTLLVATLARWHLNPEAVDVVIAASVAYVGWRVLRGRPARWAPTATAIFGFGLIHGLGLSTRLQEVALPDGGALIGPILAFNLGVEIGQLAALTVIVATGVAFVRATPPLRELSGYVAAGLVAFGALSALVLAFLAIREDGSNDANRTSLASVLNGAAGGCIEGAYNLNYSPLGGGHPDKVFYPPGEAPPRDDLLHVMGDGYVVVAYRINLAKNGQDALERWANETSSVVVVPATAKAPFEVEALSSQRRLTCERLDTEALSSFRSSVG